jgi:cysteinyl-tRNA synthetase
VVQRLTAAGDATGATRLAALLEPLTAALAAGAKTVATLGAATSELAAAVVDAAGGAAQCTGEVAPAAAPWDVQDEYLALARRFEREFMEDMDALGVVRPDVVTRVSEFVPQIVAYIQAIIDKGAPCSAMQPFGCTCAC